MFINKTYISICAAILISVVSYAQTTITSVVKSKNNQEILLGATIINMVTKKSAMSNNNGEFSLEVKDLNHQIKVSYYGYNNVVFKANNIPKEIYLEPKLESLHQVIVSASRTKEKKHDVPVAISVVTKKTITEMQPNDVSEVLNQKPGVLMVDLGNEQHMMAIRQPITTKSVFLYLEDGLPIRPTGIFNHNALLETNINAVENIEIIRGAYSSLYGSEAIGGAVNFITEKPSEDLNIAFGARANNIGYQRFDGKISGTIGKTGFYVSTYRSSIVDGFRDYGDFEKSAITAKITHQFSENFDIENSINITDYRSDMSGSIEETAFKERDFSSLHTFTFRDANSLRVSSTLNYKWNDENNSFAKFFYRDNSLKQNPSYRISGRSKFNAIAKTGELNKSAFKSYGVLAQHNIKVSDVFKFKVGGIVDLTRSGFEAENLEVFRNTEGVFESFTALGSYSSDYKTDILNTGAFATGEYKITEQLRLNGGLRVDAFQYDFKNKLGNSAKSFQSPDTKETFWSVTPRLGVVYNTGKYGSYANYSKGFIPPSVGELFKKTEVPLLDPSQFHNYEIGGFTSLIEHKLYLDVAAYYLSGKDEIVSVRTIDTVTDLDSFGNQNTGSSEHYGFEYKVEFKFNSEILLRNSGAVSRHKFKTFVTKVSDGGLATDYNGNDMPGAPAYINNLGFIVKPKILKGFRLGLEWQALGKYYTDPENTISYGGYNVYNARMSYQFKKVAVWLNVLNLFDYNYATRASTGFGRTTFTPGNPRNITVGIRYSLK